MDDGFVMIHSHCSAEFELSWLIGQWLYYQSLSWFMMIRLIGDWRMTDDVWWTILQNFCLTHTHWQLGQVYYADIVKTVHDGPIRKWRGTPSLLRLQRILSTESLRTVYTSEPFSFSGSRWNSRSGPGHNCEFFLSLVWAWFWLTTGSEHASHCIYNNNIIFILFI